MCPVDLAHIDDLKKALQVAGRTAKEYGAEIVYCGVAPVAPGQVSHSPKEYAEKLEAVAGAEGETYGVPTSSLTKSAVDPNTKLNELLCEVAEELNPDLIVMGTHTPNLTDHFWASHGNRLARATNASIFLVRGDK